MNLISEDYLMHHGVKGMKWGVRHDPYKSARGSFHRGLSKVYSLNERTYRKLGNNTLASMNAAAKNEQLKKAQQADANKKKNVQAIERAKNQKNAAKLEKYQSKLIKKADKKSGNYRRDARENKNEIDDMNKMGFKSAYWKQHVSSQSKQYAQEATSKNKRAGYSDRDAETWGTLSGSVKYLTTISNKKAFDTRISELKETRSNSIRLAKTYTANKKALMDTPITATTRKKDLKKIYRKNLSLFE